MIQPNQYISLSTADTIEPIHLWDSIFYTNQAKRRSSKFKHTRMADKNSNTLNSLLVTLDRLLGSILTQ